MDKPKMPLAAIATFAAACAGGTVGAATAGPAGLAILIGSIAALIGTATAIERANSA